jgi:hypothetical protein
MLKSWHVRYGLAVKKVGAIVKLKVSALDLALKPSSFRTKYIQDHQPLNELLRNDILAKKFASYLQLVYITLY